MAAIHHHGTAAGLCLLAETRAGTGRGYRYRSGTPPLAQGAKVPTKRLPRCAGQASAQDGRRGEG